MTPDRKAFEAWGATHDAAWGFSRRLDNPERYLNTETESAWFAWQAALRTAAPAVTDDERVVREAGGWRATLNRNDGWWYVEPFRGNGSSGEAACEALVRIANGIGGKS